ncbi:MULTISPECIES: serine protease Do-like protein HtrB [unclassified Bacillus (in: firmicutes)]|uniref:serine protease Do-like protein HtrB n=1 Tax=unclassified Bacillus (in: firmicutes) TaxID=185979 RepID=UPI00227F124F|nr:serine protease Do-like protein HtrB [Bacillus sp. S20C3]MCY8204828.1 serine protease Do-like protein HtrB [Bacillus sp. N12A5]MCY8288769.1 serine protease Do-like protein HtrB [Bacillus sp. N13C7]MCY8640398.1 serine protease Do-like protein HtrB [Bacillus sp. S17B2]MCY8720341.1 serine protease Do-like protein HtrB [Bacillus sp. S10C12M]MCY9142222.1 serine protease Do-like protein HtrB [Bacillus sp. T9C1]
MDYRRDDQNDQHQTESSHTEHQNSENRKLIEHPEQELLDAPVSYGTGRQETASAIEMEKKETAVKKEKKRRAAWLSPILGGIIGGGLMLGIAPYLPSDHDQTETVSANKQVQSDNFTTTPITNASNVADMVEDLEPTIVGISNIQTSQNNTFGTGGGSSSESESGTGSGVIFKKDSNKAYIITNNHVVEGANKLTVTLYNGETETAKLVGSDTITDLAVLEISSKNVKKVASFGDSSQLRTGEKVIAIGNPLGQQFSGTVTQGIISGLNRTIDVDTTQGTVEMNVLQTDAAINPGNSGGPLINASGQVIGINSLKVSESGVESLGFAIPSNDVEPIVDQLLENGKVDRPFLGVQMIDMSQVPETYQENTLGLFGDQLGKGVYVKEVQANSPAAKAGVKSEDVIVKLNGKDVESSADIRQILYKDLKVGDKTTIQVLRNGKTKTLNVALTKQTESSTS